MKIMSLQCRKDTDRRQNIFPSKTKKQREVLTSESSQLALRFLAHSNSQLRYHGRYRNLIINYHLEQYLLIYFFLWIRQRLYYTQNLGFVRRQSVFILQLLRIQTKIILCVKKDVLIYICTFPWVVKPNKIVLPTIPLFCH